MESQPLLHKQNSSQPNLDSSEIMKVDSSILDTGGVLIISGPSGTGKAELAEYVLIHAVSTHKFLPLFATLGDRPNEKLRPVSELLRSSLAALRSLDPTIPEDDTTALKKLLPDHKAIIDWLGPSLGYGYDRETQKMMQREELEDPDVFALRKKEARKAVVCLVKQCVDKRKMIVLMPLIRGTNLYHMETSFFWDLLDDLGKIANTTREDSSKCLVLLLTLRAVEQTVPAAVRIVDEATKNGWLVHAAPLDQNCVREYCAVHLKVAKTEIPPPLLEFVTNLSCGIASYIRETLEQLMDNGNLEVRRKSDSNEIVYASFESLNIATWHQTAMVGGAICLLESLDPMQAAVVKMATVFAGPFTISDLAASSCSRWAGATRFDTLLLFTSLNILIKCGIIDAVAALDEEDNINVNNETDASVPLCLIKPARKDYFALNNFLIRTVGASMILEQQKKAIKRQALIERVLQKDLPARMEALARKKAIPHIPWYYQIEVPNKRPSLAGQKTFKR